MNIRVDHYVHLVGSPDDLARVERTLKEIKEQLTKMTNQNATDLAAIVQRIDDSTNKIAADIRTLAAQIGTGLSQSDVDALKTSLEAKAVALENLDAETPDA